MNKKGILIAAAVAVALVIGFFVSPFASSHPDGLERVAHDKGFASAAKDSTTAKLPTADYGISGVNSDFLSTALAGVLGVTITFGLIFGALAISKRVIPLRT